MKKTYNDAVFFLILHIATILVLEGGQLLGVAWPYSKNNAFGRMLTHPGLVAIHLFFSSSLLFLFWLKNEKNHKLMYFIALFACVYGAFISFTVSIGIDFALMLGAAGMIRYSAPLAFPDGFGIFFSKPIHRADEDEK
ncbi:MAG: hypothetical protein V4495_26875 [Pseudomonadota bacterium]